MILPFLILIGADTCFLWYQGAQILKSTISTLSSGDVNGMRADGSTSCKAKKDEQMVKFFSDNEHRW